MPIGPRVRRLLGPFEKPVAIAYRNLYFDLDSLPRWLQERRPADAILEIGCGEGALVESLARAYPSARVVGIDITPAVGRLLPHLPDRVTFHQQTLERFAPDHEQTFDLVVLCDVLHHIPWEMHAGILRDARRVLKPGGHLALKDWEKSRTPMHLMAYVSDRFITGDKGVRFGRIEDFRRLVREVFGQGSIESEARLPPRKNNFTLLAARQALP
jgi:2-polyprenyl-3-methyl-5-hydroxy-6-metoxy-1,4-benzoquinol methylase